MIEINFFLEALYLYRLKHCHEEEAQHKSQQNSIAMDMMMMWLYLGELSSLHIVLLLPNQVEQEDILNNTVIGSIISTFPSSSSLFRSNQKLISFIILFIHF